MGHVDVVIVGATGHAGRRVAHELVSRGASLVLAGRDRARLEALARELGPSAEVAIIRLDDPAGVGDVVRRGRVVLGCAGPFAQIGAPVLDAALSEGRHYLDISGEIGFATTVLARHDLAKARGLTVVPACGFDVVATEPAAVIACEALGEPVAEVRITVASTTQPSRGSVRTLLDGLASGDYAWAWRDGALSAARIGDRRWRVTLPEPFGVLPALAFGLPDVVLAPLSTGAAHVTTGLALASPNALARTASTAAWLSRRAPWMWRALRWLALRLTPVGGTEGARAKGRFAVEVCAVGATGATAVVRVWGPDAVTMTGAAAAIAAIRLGAGENPGAGVLTPSQAFGARRLLDDLASAGVRWELEPAPSTAVA